MAAALVAAVAAACSGGSGGGNSVTGPMSQPSVGTTVQATPQLAFTPQSVTIKSGDAVTWAFGSVAHTVTFDTTASSSTPPSGGNPYPTGNVVAALTAGLSPRAAVQAGAPADISPTSGASVSRTFGTTGTFHYHCSIHPQMTGVVTVQ